MRIKTALALIAASLVLAAPAVARKPAQAAPTRAQPVSGNWNARVTVTPAGTRVLGNPDAKVKLTEYVSYTCPHCAHFEEASAGQLKLVFVASGKGSIEVRHILRDPIDMAIALIANCVEPRRFFQIHEAFMRGQDRWEALLQGMNADGQKHWSEGDRGSRMRAIASDLQFYPIAERFGLSRAATDRCLADPALMERLANQTRDAANAGIDSTPSFAVDGTVLAGTHDWATLGPQLAARM